MWCVCVWVLAVMHTETIMHAHCPSQWLKKRNSHGSGAPALNSPVTSAVLVTEEKLKLLIGQLGNNGGETMRRKAFGC